MQRSGEITHQPTGRSEPFEVYKLGMEDMDDLIAMQAVVQQSVMEKDTLQALTKEEFVKVLSGEGLLIGVYVHNKPVAFRALLYPGGDPENLGRDLGLPKEEWEKVVHQEISCVLPSFRGNGLQKKMGQWIMDAFHKENKDKRHLFCTVHPANTASLKDKLTQGMAIVKIKDKYEGMLRYILYRPVQKPLEWDRSTEVSVDKDELAKQKKLLNQGYYGFAYMKENRIVFAKKKENEIS